MTDMRGKPRRLLLEAQSFLSSENKKFPGKLKRIPVPENLPPSKAPFEIWRSCHFMVQVFSIEGFSKMERLSINRTNLDLDTGHWRDSITWDELMEIKRQCGRGDCDAVEIFPADKDIVNVANMRHLWICGFIPFMWRQG
jgi:hypothetical protein